MSTSHGHADVSMNCDNLSGFYYLIFLGCHSTGSQHVHNMVPYFLVSDVVKVECCLRGETSPRVFDVSFLLALVNCGGFDVDRRQS